MMQSHEFVNKIKWAWLILSKLFLHQEIMDDTRDHHYNKKLLHLQEAGRSGLEKKDLYQYS